jgi:class 3 adenylate cyclase
VTFLFTDIEGSTRLVQTLGDGWVSVLDAHNELVGGAIATNEGVVVKTEGDSFFAVFPSASDALVAAVAAQRALMEHPWPENGVVRSRMGLHTSAWMFIGRHESPMPPTAGRWSSRSRPRFWSSASFLRR